jgi:glycosyltransferase involved in cell wall biosynthesis
MVTQQLASIQPQRTGCMLIGTPLSSEPLVSVVTPVYNGEPYLAQCIESVLAQTYHNWEYTILNNCSTDRSLEIAQSYAARDPRIVVKTTDVFLTQSRSLSTALAAISPDSKYCKMVLADDWVFPHCLEEMVRVAELHPSVAIVSSYRLDGRRVTCAGLPPESTFFQGRSICRGALVDGIFVFGSPNTLLYRSDIVRGRVPFFNEDSLHEDTEACYEILMQHDFGFVHQVLTFTRRQHGSLTSTRSVLDPHHLLDKLITTLKYGQGYLDPEEYRTCWRKIEGSYYRFLAARALGRADAPFWEYHRAALQQVDYRIDRGRLAGAVARAFLRRIANPWPHVARLARSAVGGRDD